MPQLDIATFPMQLFWLAVTFGLPGMTDFMQWDSVIAEYEELTGHKVENLEWFTIYAALRFAIVSIRTSSEPALASSARPSIDFTFWPARSQLERKRRRLR